MKRRAPAKSWVRNLCLPVTRMHVPFLSASLAWFVEQRMDPQDRELVTTVRGLRWKLDLNELIDFQIYYLGTYERFTSYRIRQLARPSMHCFDIGANCGYFTLLLAQRVGRAGRVYAFEPMHRAWLRLTENIRLNHFSNAIAERMAVANVDGLRQVVQFQHSWSYFHPPLAPGPEEVPVTTLDAYAAKKGVTRVDLVKVDVDGYEFKVLSGAVRTLERFRPHLIVEFGRQTLHDAGDSLDDLIRLLAGLGYSFYSERAFRRYRSTHDLAERVPENGTINVICIAG